MRCRWCAAAQMRAIGVTTKERSAVGARSSRRSPNPGCPISTSAPGPVCSFRPARRAAIVDRLNAETRTIAGDKDYVARIESMGTDVASSSPEAFGTFVRDDIARWTEVIERAGIPQID